MRGKRRKNKTGIELLLGFVFAAVFLLCTVENAQAATTQETPVAAKGIDVSRWQGDIEWEKVKDDGIEFVMLGIGRYRSGQGIPDPLFEHNMQQALAQGIHVGVYLYSEAKNEEEAREEAKFVLEQIDGYKISYPVAFDIEDDIHRNMTTKQRTDITIAFLEVIEKAGYYPMIYASESWFNSSMDLARLRKYDKWVARWGSFVAFEPLSMWQYSSTGRVKGISGNVDLDYSYKDYAKIIPPRLHANSIEEIKKSGWNTNGKKYWYVNEDGTIPKNTFLQIGKKRYYVNKKGYRVTGWKNIGGKCYYFKKNGVMKTGWLNLDGKKYYLKPVNGVRKTGWLTLDGKKYYLDKCSGTMCRGWKKIKNKYYYFSTKTGEMRKGWLTFGDKKYYMNKNGQRASGWKKLDGKWYYFGPKTGQMQKNKTIGRYHFGSDGVCLNR